MFQRDKGDGMKTLILIFGLIISTCLFARSIYQVNLDGTGIEEVIAGVNAGSLGIDEVDGKIYWLQDDPPKIRRANMDGTNIEDLVTSGLNVPRGIDVDEVGRKLYWTDRSNDQIMCSELDGSNVVTIISGVDRVQGIEVEPVEGKIYWSQEGIGHPGYICRANLDGTGSETLVSADMDPEDVAVDRDNGKIYWTENRYKFIQSANLDGSNPETIVSGLSCPFGIEVDVAGGKIYWGEVDYDCIQRANLDGSNLENFMTGLIDPNWIALDIPAQKIYWSGGSEDGPAQRPYEFTELASIEIEQGSGRSKLATGPDGTVYHYSDGSGLHALSYVDTGFTTIAHLPDINNVLDMQDGLDSTIYLARGDLGLYAYELLDSNFVQLAHLDSVVDVIAVGPDLTINTSNQSGLWAYALAGSSFDLITQIDNMGGYVAYGLGDTFFSASDLQFQVVLKAFVRNDSSYSCVRTDTIDTLSWLRGLVVTDDNIVIPFSEDGGVAYDYNGTDFSHIGTLWLGFRRSCFYSGCCLDWMCVTDNGHVVGWWGGYGNYLVPFSVGDSPAIVAETLGVPGQADEGNDGVIGPNGILFVAGGSTLIAYRYAPISVVAINSEKQSTPNDYYLYQNYPNPFNPITNIRYSISENSDVHLIVYDLTGREVRDLVNQSLDIGVYEIQWDGMDSQGRQVATGVYFARLTAGRQSDVIKMVYLR